MAYDAGLASGDVPKYLEGVKAKENEVKSNTTFMSSLNLGNKFDSVA